jgi:hypothetical protein
MRGSLGEKVGQGESADIHAWAPGRVVKLFKVGTEQRLSPSSAPSSSSSGRVPRPFGSG